MLLCSFGHRSSLLGGKQEHRLWVERSEPVEVPLPSTAEGFLAVPTDIVGVLSTSPTESQGVCPHYVKRGLRAPGLGERLPNDLSISHSTQRRTRKQGSMWERDSEMNGFPTLRRTISPWTLHGWTAGAETSERGIYRRDISARSSRLPSLPQASRSYGPPPPPVPRLAHSGCPQRRASPLPSGKIPAVYVKSFLSNLEREKKTDESEGKSDAFNTVCRSVPRRLRLSSRFASRDLRSLAWSERDIPS
jgi:hypothetical protein